MTYEEFKKELFYNITLYEETKGKTIKLFEQRQTFIDKESINIIKNINFYRFGFKSIMISDDILCACWKEKNLKKYRYWLLRDLYSLFLENGWNEVIPGIIVRLQNEEKSSYERIRHRFVVKPLNVLNNSYELENCVYWLASERIALVLYDMIYEEYNNSMMLKVSRDLTDKWGMPDEELLKNALMNTRIKMPPRLFHGDDLHYRYRNDLGVFMPDDGETTVVINKYDRIERANGYRLTTTQREGGAVAIFYPGVKERIAELIGGDYYVGFMSVDEAVVYPVSARLPAELRKKICSANVRMDGRKILSCSIFRYCRARRELIEV